MTSINKTVTDRLNTLRLLYPNLFPDTLSTNTISWFSWLDTDDNFTQFQKFVKDFQEKVSKKEILVPLVENVWEWTKAFPLSETKVVILMDSPTTVVYNRSKDQRKIIASGIALHTTPSYNETWNMILSSADAKKLFKLPSGYTVNKTPADLTPWIKKKMLLLNSALTLDTGFEDTSNSIHYEWLPITEMVLAKVWNACPNAGFICMGRYATDLIKSVVGSDFQKRVWCTGHPSPRNEYHTFDPTVFTDCMDFLKDPTFFDFP